MSINSSQDLEKGINDTENIENSQKAPYQHHVHNVSIDGDLVRLGNQTYKRSELLNAFAGDFNPGIHPRPSPSLANPVPLGLASFSFCCLVLSLCNAQVRGVTNNKVIVGASLFYGGFIELVAGLLCYPIGNTYGMTVFGAFGGFWISYGCIITDQFNVVSSYADDPTMFNSAMGFFLAGWAVFTFLMLMCTLKSTWGLFLLLFFLEITFLLLTIGTFTGTENVSIAGGYFGILSSVCGWYSLYSGVADDSNSYIPIKAYFMPNAPTV
ncbi:unnamed protein product [Kluyveromyces dobzhanskii CBS 2104]|uniref:WGS project CCBQ000000000 data, contig 00106 n=1 Tax=Kluyveromyces dobzhanskii CBS 2104 TaxID=1427455 RepID=A0A0A8L7M4_9SACH|nr:unnamed protein product [Kluyveromyces dobzhanskii CBS 2104]